MTKLLLIVGFIAALATLGFAAANAAAPATRTMAVNGQVMDISYD